ncbi:T9SS type A sorting domain-containing protein [Lentimicrobium sp. L6]|uniref:T9SS type A sorting domain-containing protein n=1 Tax=Lentimicrobium sp. L6 TaxID=2735916 RepID=UPI001551DC6F|nr:T9SS type A sorting domain-containing protein [Lentimicrobium sp. L6]NPD86319.1 T9SS type A sorting domain-containing protein [Lentimicrobium sp. L6]
MKKNTLLLLVLFGFNNIYAQWYNETINFESPSSMIWIDDSQENNIWQIGTPQKEYFDEAYSVPYAILTDTLQSYGENIHSSFIVSVKDWLWFEGSPAILSFKHKFDTDTLSDGGYIDVSYDNGETWLSIIHDTTMFNCEWSPGYYFYSENFYDDNDTLFNGNAGFSGRSDDWETASFEWLYCLGVKDYYPDSLMIRFNFISDDIASNKAGWMIDDIKLQSFECSSVSEKENTISSSIYPNPINRNSVLKIEGWQGKSYDIEIFDLNGKLVYSQMNNASSFPLNNISFNPGIYFYQISTDNEVKHAGKFVK